MVDELRVLLDRSRLAVAGALAVAPATIDELAERTTLPHRKVLEAVGDLIVAGLVTRDGDRCHLDLDALRRLARQLASAERPMDPAIGFGMTDGERVVLARFFEGRTLREIPANRAKRLVVLERLALEFEVGRRYPESEVNEMLGVFHADTAALRRYLVDEEFLDRANNTYWRSGGRVDPAPETLR